MRKILQNPLLVPLIAVAVILVVMFQGQNYERATLSYFLRGIVPAPHFLQRGSGDDGVVWHVRSISNSALERELATPAIILLQDDPDGVFQSSPHAPLDFALITRNMARIGGDTAAIGAVLAWDSPDEIGLTALERALENFDHVVTTVPLSRGATAESMPSAFRRASLPMTAVIGDASALPVVNRQTVPGAFLGGPNAVAGFTFLETNDDSEQPFLMAKWDDRVVFSFPFLTAVQQAGLNVDALQIHPGSHIRMGTSGWMIPIDEAGRMQVRVPSTHGWRETPAESLLSAERNDWTGSMQPSIWLMRDDRGGRDAIFRDHSMQLVPLVKAIASGAALTEPKELYGVPPLFGWVLLGAVVVLLGALCRFGGVAIQVGLVLTFVGMIALQWTALSVASLWMPAMPAILAINVVWIVALPIILSRRNAKSMAMKPDAAA
jgi:hypothetical protein